MDVISVSDPTAIEDQLQRILSSPAFKATPRQRKFLQFVIERSINGRADEIKGYTVATDVFGRKKNFDPKTDPIVSIEAKRLRRALEHYYLVAGTQDMVRIDIPKGSYVPAFYLQRNMPAACFSPGKVRDNNYLIDGWPSVLVRPFQNFSEGMGPNFMAEGCTTELAIELSRYQNIRVLMKPTSDRGQPVGEPTARFSIEGNIRCGSDVLNVAVQLFDQKTGRQIWGDVYACDHASTDLIVFQREVSQHIAARIAQEQGYITQTLSLESLHKPPAEMETYEALLKFYKHEATFTAESLNDALAALELACTREPQCSLVWACLGRLYSENYALETLDRPTSVEKAIEYSEKGVRLDPSNQRARAALAMARLHNNQLEEGLIEARNALALNSNSLIFMDVIGHVLALLGDWDRGVELIMKSIELNPYHRPYIYHVLCADRLRKKEYEKAYFETLNFRVPSLFWDPLLQASTLGHLGRVEEGIRFARALLKLKPDFAARGRVLVQHWIKFDELAEGVIEGLGKVGISLN